MCHCSKDFLIFLLLLIIFITLVWIFMGIYYIVLLFSYPIEPNFFSEIESRKNVGLIVDMPFCKIMNLTPFDMSLKGIWRKLPDINCDPKNKHWTYTNEMFLVLNETNIEEFGYNFSAISCCYYSIFRISQDLDNYDQKADNLVGISDNCTEIKNITTLISDEFIKVQCDAYDKLGIYEQLHIYAQPSVSERTLEKIEFWKNSDISEKPPNILLIGIDSVSRLSSIRNMPRTREILKQIGGIEFFGQTKVAGYSPEDMTKFCENDETSSQDDCPYIWKEFDKLNYFTGEIEDIFWMSTFNYIRTGFVEQPTDFYYRPLSISQHFEFEHLDDIRSKCIGYEKQVKTMLNYNLDLIKMSQKLRVPLFMHSWINHLAHNNVNGAQLGDFEFANFFNLLQLNNTFLVFMSDHGNRFGRIKTTFSGWLEVNLPVFWIILSQDLKDKYPHWVKNLEKNSKKLTSPYDLYQTMIDIIKITTNVQILPDASTLKGEKIPRKFGQSLITSEIQKSRNCSNAGIPSEFCSCLIPKNIPLDDVNLKKAAEKAITHINTMLPSNCSQLSLKSLNSGALLQRWGLQNETEYIVGFTTEPGKFKFEANVHHFMKNDSFVINSKIFRSSQIDTDVSCVHDRLLELYCFCSSQKNRAINEFDLEIQS